MHLENYISDLLYRYECVIVPEFGAFLTQKTSATVHQATNAFYPPKKTVSFNEQIQQSDGLLANYISDAENITFNDASKRISKYVKDIKLSLIRGESILFNNIGELKFNKEGKIVFEPSQHLNYLTDAFGLSQFVWPEVKREVYKEEVQNIEKYVPLSITPEKRKSKSFFKYAAIALIALTVGGFAASNYYINQIETYNQIAQEEAAVQLETKIQEATFVIKNPLPAITFNVTKQTGIYHIVAGAFRIEKNCDKKIAQLERDGFKARKIGANKYGLHQVVYSSHEDRLEALETLRHIKRTHNKNAWLLVEDLN